MQQSKAADVLRALAADDRRPDAKRLRDIFDDVEAAIAAGHSRAAVLEKLKEAGFKYKLSGFAAALHRIRIERAEQGMPAKVKQPVTEIKPNANIAPEKQPEKSTARPGVTLTEQILSEPVQHFSFKKQTQEKETQ